MIVWSNVLVPIASMLITVFATLYTVSKRVENENKEKHKPYITLETIEPLSKLDEYKYYLMIDSSTKEEKNYMNVLLKLYNIGYGVASNIKFYNLKDGSIIKGLQSGSDNINQKLFTTLDIPSDNGKQIQVKLNINNKEKNHEIICIYQDLNGNIYDFVININIKTPNSFDFSAYQRTSHSYNTCIQNEPKQYKKIIKNYKK